MFNIFLFLIWTLYLYLLHRLIHITPYVNTIHRHHHVYVFKHPGKWHWSNVFLWNDDLTSTIDLWITDVLPTVLFCWVFNCWWLLVFYWVWAGFFQEALEHNTRINLPGLTAGRWHMAHHKNPKKNFGLFIPVWDKIFKTELRVQ